MPNMDKPYVIGKGLHYLSFFSKKYANKLAFKLFCSPQKGRFKEEHKSLLSTAEQSWLKVGTYNVKQYHWKGTGKTIVLLHGWESNSLRWKNLIVLLQNQNYNIVTIDAPAHGASSGTQLHILLYTKCLNVVMDKFKPNYVVGHSMGAMTAIYHQHLYNTPYVEKIVCLAPPSELQGVIYGYCSFLGLTSKFRKQFEIYIEKRFNISIKSFSMAKFAKNIQCKGLIILDVDDSIAPYRWSKHITKNWKEAEEITVKGIGHSLNTIDIDKQIMTYINQL